MPCSSARRPASSCSAPRSGPADDLLVGPTRASLRARGGKIPVLRLGPRAARAAGGTRGLPDVAASKSKARRAPVKLTMRRPSPSCRRPWRTRSWSPTWSSSTRRCPSCTKRELRLDPEVDRRLVALLLTRVLVGTRARAVRAALAAVDVRDVDTPAVKKAPAARRVPSPPHLHLLSAMARSVATCQSFIAIPVLGRHPRSAPSSRAATTAARRECALTPRRDRHGTPPRNSPTQPVAVGARLRVEPARSALRTATTSSSAVRKYKRPWVARQRRSGFYHLAGHVLIYVLS